MANFQFSDYVGQSLAFDPNVDALRFSDGIDASSMRIRADGSDSIILLNGQSVRLVGASYPSLISASFIFENGSSASFGTASNNSLTGTAWGDYADIAQGGAAQIQSMPGTAMMSSTPGAAWLRPTG